MAMVNFHFQEIADSAKMLEAFAAQLPALWRKSKYRVKGLIKAAQYNDCLCIIKTSIKGGRVGIQLLNEERSELSIKRENIELVDDLIRESDEPEIHQALQRLRLCRSPSQSQTRDGVSSAAVNWARALLDLTYQVEVKIIDDEFEDLAGFLEVRSAPTGPSRPVTLYRRSWACWKASRRVASASNATSPSEAPPPSSVPPPLPLPPSLPTPPRRTRPRAPR